MFAPISIMTDMSKEMVLLIYFFIGIGFGFFLERGGLGNSKVMALQFYFRNMTVFKVMFTAIITGMTGLILLNAVGWLDLGSIYMNKSFLWPGIVGGLVMGVGFAVGGYCPGTSIVGLSTLKMDALFYILGSLFGMFIFGETVPYFEKFFKSGLMADNGTITIQKYFGMSSGLVAFIVIIIALLGFWGSEKVEKYFRDKETKNEIV